MSGKTNEIEKTFSTGQAEAFRLLPFLKRGALQLVELWNLTSHILHISMTLKLLVERVRLVRLQII